MEKIGLMFIWHDSYLGCNCGKHGNINITSATSTHPFNLPSHTWNSFSTTLQRLLLPGELSYLSFRSFCMQLTALQRLRLLGRGQRLAATLASTAEKPGR